MGEEFGESFATYEGEDIIPPTPRPDVEGILKEKNQTCYVRTSTAISLCNYALAVEKERDALKAIEVGASFAKQDELDEVGSLLARLAEAVEERDAACSTKEYHAGQIGATRRYIQTADDFNAALTAAKEHFEKEEKDND